MKYFDIEKMGEIRRELDLEIQKWPGVSSREMMGCLCYLRGKNMIAFLVTNGIMISKLTEEEQSELSKQAKTVAFKMAGKPMRKPVWNLKTSHDLQIVLPFVRKSYDATLASR
jgi:hypothetical protein